MKYFELQREVLKDWIAYQNPVNEAVASVWNKGEDDVIEGFTTVTDSKALYFIEKRFFLLDFPKIGKRAVGNETVNKFINEAALSDDLLFDHIEIDSEKRKVAIYKRPDGEKTSVDTKYLKFFSNFEAMGVRQRRAHFPLYFYEADVLRAVIMPLT